MKKILLFVSVLAITFASCSSDDSSTNTLIGKWEHSKQGVYENGEETISDYQHQCNQEKDYIAFHSNGTCNLVDYSNTCEEDNILTDYTLVNNTITINFSFGEPMILEIVEQTNTTLKVNYPESHGIQFFAILTKQ